MTLSAKTILILQCSPRAAGVSDRVAEIFAQGASEAGAHICCLPLRCYNITPCTGCRFCAHPPHNCVIATSDCGQDQAETIFAMLHAAPILFLAAPIYFYALPAHFKALIDRSQRFWAARSGKSKKIKTNPKPIIVALTAGRKRGQHLFSGTILTLSYFADVLGAKLEKNILLRGLEEPADLIQRKTLCKNIENLGRYWGAIAATCS